MTDVLEARQNELKTKKICRFCLSQDEANLTNIYSRENRMKAPLPLQVMACVSIEVFSNECMPSYVCNECRMMFNYCYCFKQMCKKADTCLRHFPLTGVWSAPLTKPKLSPELLKSQVSEPPVSLNALQVQRSKGKKTIIEKVESADGTFVTVVTEDHPQEEQVMEEMEAESEPEPEDEKPKIFHKPPEKPNPKLLNKSAIRILNKEAKKEALEPRISKPRLKRDNDGNIAIVTEILDPEMAFPPDPIENAAPVETNVFPCPHCERSFPLRQLLDIHMVNHNRERSFNCSECEKSFFSKYDLQKHTLVHTGEKPFKCVVCNKGFTRSTLLHRHEKTHTDIPKFICVFCEKPFISEKELEQHTERHRKNRPFTCKICSKSFAFKQGLERHEVVHCRFQPFQCQYCEQSFSTPSKLSRHLTAHAGDRPYPCKLCPKSYLLSHHLTRHMRSHKNGSGSYKCNDCDKTFSSRDDLIYHSAVHATQTLVCPLCKDAFEDIETVTAHVKQHVEGEAYACEFCDLIFMTADRLQEHTDADHADEMVAYNEDDQANAEKKSNEAKNAKANESNPSRDIDEVIEEYLYEELSEAGAEATGANDRGTSVVVKEETEWQTQSVETEVEKYDFDEETNAAIESEYLKILEMSDAADETPAKVTKISETVQQVTKKASPSKAPLRHKPLAKSSASPHSNSSQPKENKKPVPKTTTETRIKVESGNLLHAPKTRQPTIQAALQGLPKSVSVKVVPPGSKPQPETKPSESPKETKTNTATRPLRQRPEVKKPPVKSPAAPAKKTANSENAADNSKIVEMMIGDKRVKVQRITMTKSQAAAMAREGRIQMKEGTMILKKSPSQAVKGSKKSV